MKCIHCRTETVPNVKTDEVKVDAWTFRLEIPGDHCPKCGEDYIDGPVLERVDKTVAAALAGYGADTPGAIRFMRKAMALGYADAAKLTGLSAGTLHVIEKATEPSPLLARLLGGLVFELAARAPILLLRTYLEGLADCPRELPIDEPIELVLLP